MECIIMASLCVQERRQHLLENTHFYVPQRVIEKSNIHKQAFYITYYIHTHGAPRVGVS